MSAGLVPGTPFLFLPPSDSLPFHALPPHLSTSNPSWPVAPQVADVPLQYVSKDVVKLISNWLASRDSNALQQLCINLITAVYDGLPDFKSSKQATVQPPKAKVL